MKNKIITVKNQPDSSGVDKVSIGIIAAALVIAVVVGLVAFQVVLNIVLPMQTLNLPGAPVSNNAAPGTLETLLPEDTMPEIVPTPFPWDGASRVTVLVMGLDYRDWSEAPNEPSRTDSMILVTMDPVTRTAGMLSIPRDLWVNIPGYNYGKINTAYFLGDAFKYPGGTPGLSGNPLPPGGPGLAMATVEEFLGVPIQYYAQIDFNAFVAFIDEIGGVDINVPYDMVVDPVGPGNTVFLKPGVVTLDGKTALAYARNRYTEDGEFDRSKRQQQVILAVRDNILNYYSLPKLVARAPTLYKTLSKGIRTNMTLDYAIKLAWVVPQIPEKNIKQGIITKDMAIGVRVPSPDFPDGLSALKPLPDRIRLVRDEVFGYGVDSQSIVAQATPDTQPKMIAETARVSLQNGTNDPTIISSTYQYLISSGMTIVETAPADSIYNATQIKVYGAKPYTIKFLSSVFRVSPDRITYVGYQPEMPYDVQLVLGNDWLAQNPLQ